jgi:hypothetical protein
MKSYQAVGVAFLLLLPMALEAQEEVPASAQEAGASGESETAEPALEELLHPEVPKTSDAITAGVTVGSQSFNPDISVVGDFVANFGDLNPHLGIARRNTLNRHVEVAFSQHISPSAKAVVKFAYEGGGHVHVHEEEQEENQDGHQEAEVHEHEEGMELEEGYLQFHKLVPDFQFRLGRERVPFLTFNLLDGHELPFVNRPLAVARMLGDHGLVEDGLRISYLFPTKTYLNADLAIYNNRNDTAFNGGATGDRLFFARLHGYRDWQEGRKEATWMLSYVRGPHDEEGRDADIWGAECHYQALPTQFDRQMVNVGYLRARVETAGGSVSRDGYYVHLAKRWNRYHKNEIGLLWEEAESVQPGLTDRIRQLSAYLTWYETERVRLRGQYSHAFMEEGPDSDMVFLQFDYVMGTHPPHD